MRGRDAQILALFCSIGPDYGLRPIEWTSACVVGNCLVVKNAKATNGRAIGAKRAVSLEKILPGRKAEIARLCVLMRTALHESGNWKKLLRRLGSRLARLCNKLGLRRLCLYSLRGTAVARMKDEGMDARSIAAILGHRSSNTAFSHYPSARHAKGWRSRMAISPHPRFVARVRDNYQPLGSKLPQCTASLRLR